VIDFLRRAPGQPRRLGILPGTFNPPTRAHIALAHAATPHVDEVLFVLPREFPHKPYDGAAFAERIDMLQEAADDPRFSIASTAGGLFIEIARECRDAYRDTQLSFLCGRDAAERIVNWDYGDPAAFAAMLDEFDLRVAARRGHYDPPAHLASRIQMLPIESGYDELSATDVRDRIARGEPWEHLVPEAIVPLVRRIYGRTNL
jgi:nicotinate (nicotinamide) nucleotide adenylyltransferase